VPYAKNDVERGKQRLREGMLEMVLLRIEIRAFWYYEEEE
jgi:hypothetical protein